MKLKKKLRTLLAGIAGMVMLTVGTISVCANPSGSEELPSSMIMTPTISLTVRNAPGMEGAVVGYINPGEEVVATSNKGGWFMIAFEDQAQFVYGQYMSYLSEEDGSFNENNAKKYCGNDPNGIVYYKGQPLSSANEPDIGNEKKPAESPETGNEIKAEPLDLMMTAEYDVNIRQEPNGVILDVLQKGADIHVTGNVLNRSWYQCEYNGKTVYVCEDYLQPDFPQTMKSVCAVNVRETPDTSKTPVGLLQAGDKIKVSAEENGWYRFSFEKTGKKAYVFGEYFTVVK